MSQPDDASRRPDERAPVLDKLEALLARQRVTPAAPPAGPPVVSARPTASAPPPLPRVPVTGADVPLLSEAVGLPLDLGVGPTAPGVPTLTEALPDRLTPGAARPASVAPASRDALRAALVARLPADLESQVRDRALAALDRAVDEHERALALWRERQAAQLQARVHAAIDSAIDAAIDRALLGASPPPRD